MSLTKISDMVNNTSTINTIRVRLKMSLASHFHFFAHAFMNGYMYSMFNVCFNFQTLESFINASSVIDKP